MRPMTVGEVLDAALALLRLRAKALIGLGLLLATAEQALLSVLRGAARMGTSAYPRDGYVWQWLIATGTGFGTEAFIVAILGGVAAGASVRALLGQQVPMPRRRGSAALAVVVVAVIAGVLCAAGAVAFAVPWFVLYPILGLAAPAVVVDRTGPLRAVRRSIWLVFRSGLRPGMIRLLGYLGWLFFRIALSAGAFALITLLPIDSSGWEESVTILSWLLVNAIAYPVLGCLDAVLHLESRMRVEGLDIALTSAIRRGEPLAPSLAVAPLAPAVPTTTATPTLPVAR